MTPSAGQPLTGRGAIITGASQGLGAVLARSFWDAGASLMLCARDGDATAAVARALPARPGQLVLSMACDVASPGQVTAMVSRALEGLPSLDVLVNNAGVYGPMGSIEEVSWDEWTQAVEINLYGSILPIRAILPHFRARNYGKIVQLSGGGATSPLPRITAYAASKAAVVRFVESLAGELAGTGIDANSIAPGALNTRLLDQVLEAGPEKVGEPFYQRSLRQRQEGGADMSRAASLAVFLASPASDGITGRLLSAVWDPWEDLPRYRDELAETDVYTLRRIVPGDRGKDWDRP